MNNIEGGFYWEVVHHSHTVTEKNWNRLSGWTSEPMSDVEQARLFLIDGGVGLGSKIRPAPGANTTSLTGHPAMILLMS